MMRASLLPVIVAAFALLQLPVHGAVGCCMTREGYDASVAAYLAGAVLGGSPAVVGVACLPSLSGQFTSVSADGSDLFTRCMSATGTSATFQLNYQCVVTASSTGDPHITGFDGSSYLLWGKQNTTYNLLSERSHHVNIHLYHPPGRPEAHALYIDAVGIMIGDARISMHLVPPVPGSSASASIVLRVAAAGTQQDNTGVKWQGHAIERALDAQTSYAFPAPDHVVITSTDVTLSVWLVDNDHLDVHVDEVAAHWADVHGVLGQTHRAAFKLKYSYATGTAVGELPDLSKMDGKKKLSLQGQEDDYITTGLFQANDKYSRFASTATPTPTRKMLRAAPELLLASSHGSDAHGSAAAAASLFGRVICDAGVGHGVGDATTSLASARHGGRMLLETLGTCQFPPLL